MRESRSDIGTGIGLLLFCGFAAWRTLRIAVPPEETVAGTTFLPWLMIGGVALLSLVLIGRAIVRAGTAVLIEMPGSGATIRMVLFTVVMVAYGFAFMPVGYVYSTLVVCLLGLLLLGERRVPVLILFPPAITAALYLGFTKLLDVWLP